MSRPYADQKPFDRNGDGRLNAREWNEWYNSRYGIDNELSERRAVGSEVAQWESWLNYAYFCVEYQYKRFMENAQKLLRPWSAEMRQLAEHTYIGWVTTGLAAGDVLNTVLKTSAGGWYASKRIFRPYERLLQEFLNRHPGLASMAELQAAFRAKKPLYQAESFLTEDAYGSFWDKLFKVLPPYDPEALHSFSAKAFSYVPELEPLRHLVEGIITSAVLFSGKSGEDNDRYCDRYQDFFIRHWIERCGQKPGTEKPDAEAILKEVRDFIASLGEYDEDDEHFAGIDSMSYEQAGEVMKTSDALVELLYKIQPDDDGPEQDAWDDLVDTLLAAACAAEQRRFDIEDEEADE